jgi:IS5 family transposase
MRKTIREQLSLRLPLFRFRKAREYEEVSKLLDAKPEVAQWVFDDLVSKGIDPAVGRDGMSGEETLRAYLVYKREKLSYERLEFELGTNTFFREFCRVPPNRSWSRSALHRNISATSADTLEKINRLFLGVAKEEGIEDGRKVAVDPTGVETNIHFPSDSELLWDVVRVLTRLLWIAVRIFVTSEFTDNKKEAKRLYWRIFNAKRKAQRKPLYVDLLEITTQTIADAERIAAELEKPDDPAFRKEAVELAEVIRHVVALGKGVMDQTERRVLKGETVPAQEKILSIFEPHTDLLVKGLQKTYGHKVTFTSGVSGMVLDAVVEQGNPNDKTLATRMIKRQKEIYGRAPEQAAFDGGFASAPNLEDLKQEGVKDVVFTKAGGLKIKDMVRKFDDYEVLRKFRAGIEGVISYLKRCFGLVRCTWSGLDAFKAYVWGSVVSGNLFTLARQRLARERL